MINSMQLTKNWSQFQSELHDLIENANQILTLSTISENELLNFKKEFFTWDNSVKDWLKHSFVESNSYLNEFRESGTNIYNIPGHNINLPQEFKIIEGKIKSKIEYLLYNERIWSVCDKMVCPEEIDLTERANFKIKQKKELLLKKLYTIHDDHYYPVKELLDGNGIKSKSQTEADDIVRLLKEEGLVDSQGYLGGSVNAKLTIEGISWVEDMEEIHKENYNDIQFDFQEMSKKLDDIVENLNKANIGNEILFDELQELKELYKTLNKKNWGQLLKGKLLDAVLSKVVDLATVSTIYEHLTQHKLKLI